MGAVTCYWLTKVSAIYLIAQATRLVRFPPHLRRSGDPVSDPRMDNINFLITFSIVFEIAQ